MQNAPATLLLLVLAALPLKGCGDDDSAPDAMMDASLDAVPELDALPELDVNPDAVDAAPENPELQQRADQAIALLRPWFEAGWYDTVVIGLREGESTAFTSLGTLPDGAPVDLDTSYEIGSITKVLTGLLLRDATERGEVMMTTPASALLPSANIPRGSDGGVVELWHLASHTSGFPTFPDVVDPLSYDREDLFAWFETHELTREPGTAFEYSNLAMGLLGFTLGAEAGSTYAELLQDRVLEPLALSNTSLTRPPDAAPMSAALSPVPALSLMPISEAAGELRSTARDMLHFARMQLHPEEAPVPLDEAIQASHEVLFSEGPTSVGTSWLFRDEGEVLWHNGITIGSQSFLAIVPREDRAVVVLANIANHRESLRHQVWALDTLRDRDVFDRAPPEDFVIPDLAILDDYPGVYDLAGMPLTITRVGDRIEVEVPGQFPTTLFPLAEEAFYLRAAPVSVRFLRDDDGMVNAIEITQGGVVVAPRISSRVVS